MPWKTNDELPSALKALPGAAQTLFREVANKQFAKGASEAVAMSVAWGVVKKRFEKTGDKWVARTDAFRDVNFFTFRATPAEEFITRTEGGVEIHNYVLTDQWPDSFGTAPTEETMTEWARWINETQPEVDVDHELYEQVTTQYPHDLSLVKRAVRAKKGIAKAIGAVVEKGRLIVSLRFDQRYRNFVSKVKGLSIEAAAVVDRLSKKITGGDLLGFTLAVNQEPGNPRAVKTR